ncbi:MAG: hypothetical protein ABW022_11365 [Actinoplanes sp.]
MKPRRAKGVGHGRDESRAAGAYTYDWIENLFGLNDVVMAPGSLIMERRMLHGIKERAERR